MILLSLGFNSMNYYIYNKMSEISAYFKNKGINIGMVEYENGSMDFIKFIIKDEDINCVNIDDLKESFVIFASNILYDIITECFDRDIINKIVKENHSYLKNDEINYIVNKCMDITKGKSAFSKEDYFLYINRKNQVINRITDYLNENTDLILEGFLTFRLKNLSYELEKIIDKVVEEYMIEREYNEFIKLLRYFVEIQDSRIEIININANADGSYSMFDNKFNKIADEMMKDFLGDVIESEKNCDDLLVSSLITIAPKYIIIHNADNIKNKEVIETIKNVFYNKVKICTGCDFCMQSSRPIHRI